jgi:hypothetical protein
MSLTQINVVDIWLIEGNRQAAQLSEAVVREG